jgi:hypothetical protein
MQRIVIYTILGALLGIVIWIPVFHPSGSDSSPFTLGVPIGAVLGLLIAFFLNYHYRNYVQPVAQPIDWSPKGMVTGPVGWRFVALFATLICLFVAFIVSSVTGLDFAKVGVALLVISLIPVWVILGRLPK